VLVDVAADGMKGDVIADMTLPGPLMMNLPAGRKSLPMVIFESEKGNNLL